MRVALMIGDTGRASDLLNDITDHSYAALGCLLLAPSHPEKARQRFDSLMVVKMSSRDMQVSGRPDAAAIEPWLASLSDRKRLVAEACFAAFFPRPIVYRAGDGYRWYAQPPQVPEIKQQQRQEIMRWYEKHSFVTSKSKHPNTMQAAEKLLGSLFPLRHAEKLRNQSSQKTPKNKIKSQSKKKERLKA